MVAKSFGASQAQIRVLQCTECRCYVVNVGTMERSAGAAVPSQCLSVTPQLLPCFGKYEPVAQALARRLLVHIGKACLQNGTSLETLPSEDEVGGKGS